MQKEIHPVKYRKAVILPRAKLFNGVKWLLKEKYHNKPNKNFIKDIKRLEAGEPLDYVIGFTEFLRCKIDLSKKPLIPRQETEFWVGEAIKEMKNPTSRDSSGQNLRILDMFTGSGCIGVAILKNTHVLLCDLSDSQNKCLEQAKINCVLNAIDKRRYHVIKSDVFSDIHGKYDYIFANPPYIAKTRRNKIQKSVLKFEPKTALFGDKDGLFYIEKFLKEAKKHLLPGGKIFMEFDYSQKNKIQKLVKLYGYKTCEFHRDQYGKWRWVEII